MKQLLTLAIALAALSTGGHATAYETRAYEVLEEDGRFALRDYAPAIVAETIVEGDFEDVGGEAFRILVAYISGKNASRDEISMTTPVAQEPQSQKLSMTTPVTQERDDRGYRVTFVMPARFTLESLPEPTDPRVVLRAEPRRKVASVRYSGFWSRENYDRHLVMLRQWMQDRGLEPEGEPVWARYDPPFMPWFWRTNEILLSVGD